MGAEELWREVHSVYRDELPPIKEHLHTVPNENNTLYFPSRMYCNLWETFGPDILLFSMSTLLH